MKKEEKKKKEARTNLPSYYTTIPAPIRYCQKLSFFEIVLYGEIVALSNALGFCYASNSYFAKLYNKHISTISKCIAKLQKLKFINCLIEKDNGNLRRMYITPIGENANTPIGENAKYNITSNNTTSLSKTYARASSSNNENINDLFVKVYKRGLQE